MVNIIIVNYNACNCDYPNYQKNYSAYDSFFQIIRKSIYWIINHSLLRKNSSIAFLYITHDLATAKYFGDNIAVMYKGRIVESGPARAVLDDPRHPYTQALIDAVSDPDPENQNREKTVRIDEKNSADLQGCVFSSRCPYVAEQCSKEPELDEISFERKVVRASD